MLKAAELRNLSVEELQEKVQNLRKELMELRFQAKTGKLEKQSMLKNTKCDIARILTVIREKEREKVKT